MMMKTGTTGVSANFGPDEDLARQTATEWGQRETDADEGEARHEGQDGVQAEVALGQAGEHADGQQGQDVVDDGGAEDDPREGSVEHAHLSQHAAGDADARGRQREADERGRQAPPRPWPGRWRCPR